MTAKKAARKKSTSKPPVPGKVVKLTEEEVAERRKNLDDLHSAPIQMPPSVYDARRKQLEKNGTGKIGGRPTTYTPERVESFLKNLRSGLPVNRAAAMVGISNTALYSWLDTYSDFRSSLLQAETEYQAFALRTVNDGIANGDGHLAMKLLGARFSDEYATSKKVDVRTQKIDSTITSDQLMHLQSARLNTDVVSAANVIGTEEPDASESRLTTDPPPPDHPAENDHGGTHISGGTNPNTPPPLKASHTGDSANTPT